MLLNEKSKDFKKYYDEVVVDEFLGLADLNHKIYPDMATIKVENNKHTMIAGSYPSGYTSDGIPIFISFWASKEKNVFSLLKHTRKLMAIKKRPYILTTFISHDNENYFAALALSRRLGFSIVENNIKIGLTIITKVEREES